MAHHYETSGPSHARDFTQQTAPIVCSREDLHKEHHLKIAVAKGKVLPVCLEKTCG